MKRRWAYLAALLVSLYFSSLFIQSAWSKPATALQAAEDFRKVSIGFCVLNQVGSNWSIRVTDGQLPEHTLGLITSTSETLKQGDCLGGQIQLRPDVDFSRFAFRGTLKEVTGSVKTSEQLSLLNAMRSYSSKFEGDSLNLVSGLAIGQDQGLSQQFLTNMKTTGLTHLTAVSGANCAIVIGVFWFIGKLFRFGRNLRFIWSIGALVGYVTLVGPQPSVLRAAFMMSVILVSLEFGRRVWIPAALGIGSSILLVVDPWLIADYGFWLSVLATFGLVLLTPELNLRFEKHMPKPLAIALSATIAAQLWCLPVLLSLQGGLTTYSVLANLLVEPMVPLITVLGVMATVIGPWLPLVADAMMFLASIPASWVVFVANALSQSPSNLLSLPGGLVGFLGISLFVVVVSVALLKKNFLMVTFSVLLAVLWLGWISIGAVNQLKWPLKNWKLVACDVGQGDGVVIRSEDKIAVIDVGKDADLIDHCLDRLGISKVDLLVLTHFDQDHIGGLPGLQRGRTIENTLISAFPDARMATVPDAIVAQSGLTGNLGNFTWQVFSSLGAEADNANEGSLGIRLESEELVYYALADLNEKAQVKATAWAFDVVKPTIVKVAHHGSADQSIDFYQRIGADLALISVGRGNPYGHPTKRTLDALSAEGVEIVRTDEQGSIAIGVQGSLIDVGVSGSR